MIELSTATDNLRLIFRRETLDEATTDKPARSGDQDRNAMQFFEGHVANANGAAAKNAGGISGIW